VSINNNKTINDTEIVFTLFLLIIENDLVKSIFQKIALLLNQFYKKDGEEMD
jgi:hypothetical protein